ncbi:GMC oxidoreductase [Streptomyces sp. NPDC002574]|uniref:GMC oxidoreductase n=1 Tax=Streptomyces sp. NPDC002574 TaxID=3364652 RepID=UPI0036C681C3
MISAEMSKKGGIRHVIGNRDLRRCRGGRWHRIARAIGRSPVMSAWHGTEVLAGPGVEDDAALRAYVHRTLASYAHPVGTCRMGDGSGAVVGGDLRVHGIDGLRVADASVIPAIPSANTNATVCAIAERAAELLAA